MIRDPTSFPSFPSLSIYVYLSLSLFNVPVTVLPVQEEKNNSNRMVIARNMKSQRQRRENDENGEGSMGSQG